MLSIYRYLPVALFALVLGLSASPSALAHLMVAQHGTLNIVDDDAFMVLSLPISAFDRVDDDGDGEVSMIEFNRHRTAIIEVVDQNVSLRDQQGNRPLQGIMLSPVVPHDAAKEPLSQLVVMGRFALGDPSSALRFHTGLYGKQAAEQVLEITATRQTDKQKTIFKLTPKAPAALLFIDNVASSD
jgi:hypothetical protein